MLLVPILENLYEARKHEEQFDNIPFFVLFSKRNSFLNPERDISGTYSPESSMTDRSCPPYSLGNISRGTCSSSVSKLLCVCIYTYIFKKKRDYELSRSSKHTTIMRPSTATYPAWKLVRQKRLNDIQNAVCKCWREQYVHSGHSSWVCSLR